MAKRKRKKSIYQVYRKVLKKPKLSNEEIDKMRASVRLLALAIIEHVTKAKINQLY